MKMKTKMKPNKPTPILRNYIEELVKMFNFTPEQWAYLNGLAEEPTDKLYQEQLKGRDE